MENDKTFAIVHGDELKHRIAKTLDDLVKRARIHSASLNI